MKYIKYIVLSALIISGLFLLGSEGTEAGNTLTAYGKTYKVAGSYRVHSVEIDGIRCMVAGSTSTGQYRPPAISCDWDSQK